MTGNNCDIVDMEQWMGKPTVGRSPYSDIREWSLPPWTDRQQNKGNKNDQ